MYIELDKYSIVLKPIHGYGGTELIKVTKTEVLLEAKKLDIKIGMEYVENYLKDTGPLLSMKFLKNVTSGDKRVLVVNGEVLGATLRLPVENSWLCNLKQGGRAVHTEIDINEYKISERISPVLKELGVLIFGFDTLEDDNGMRCLSEINTLNAVGLLQAQEYSKPPIIKNASELIWDYILEKL